MGTKRVPNQIRNNVEKGKGVSPIEHNLYTNQNLVGNPRFEMWKSYVEGSQKERRCYEIAARYYVQIRYLMVGNECFVDGFPMIFLNK